MTGRIKLLSVGSSSGVIESEGGVRLYFDAGAVLAYDVATLSVGQLVTFDSENGVGRKAVNVCVQRPHSSLPVEKKRKESMLRYVGFDQTRAIRTYRFERTSFGEDTETFAVTTDVTLFTKYHIGIQEGPSLNTQTGSAPSEPAAAPPVSSGVLGGAYGMNGPPLAIYGALRRWSPQHFRATLQGYFFPASLIGLLGYGLMGILGRAVTRYCLLSLPGILAAIFIGRGLNHRLRGDQFFRFVYAGLVVIGGVLLTQAFRT